LDANGDEQIYYTDFLAATATVRSKLREEAVLAVFHRLDADNSGSIGVEDFRAVLGDKFEGVDVEELVREADPSGGAGISFETFVRVLEDHDAMPTPSSRTSNGTRKLCFFGAETPQHEKELSTPKAVKALWQEPTEEPKVAKSPEEATWR